MDTSLSDPRLPRSLATQTGAPRFCAMPNCLSAPHPGLNVCLYCRALSIEFDELEARAADAEAQEARAIANRYTLTDMLVSDPTYVPAPASFFDTLPGRIDVDAPAPEEVQQGKPDRCSLNVEPESGGLTATRIAGFGLVAIGASGLCCMGWYGGILLAVGLAAGWFFHSTAKKAECAR